MTSASPVGAISATGCAATLALWSEAPANGLADLALLAGESDQAHFQREFRALTGTTPGTFRALSPWLSHHVPLASDSFNPHRSDVS